MRDLVITLFVFGAVPFILRYPAVGALTWLWLSLMNPHRLSWGFAYNMPFAQIIAIATFIGIVFSSEPKRFPWSPVTLAFILFLVQMSLTTLFALQPDQAHPEWIRVMKAMLMVLVTLWVMHSRKHIEALVWVTVISLGFYGIKGGVFVIATGGQSRVYGPPESYISDNNHIAVALIATIPLMWHLYQQTSRRWIKYGLIGMALLTIAAVIGSYSRGGFLAIAAMGALLWLKSRNKIVTGAIVALTLPVVLMSMPSKWWDRMATIDDFQQDASAMGRINAWKMAMNLAADRPLVGGGFQIYDLAIFQRYAPVPDDVHAAHSIYFAALGEHGVVGLALLLLIGILTWRAASRVIKTAAKNDELAWARDLASMLQVALIGYAVGGAFLSILYAHLPWYLMAITVLLERHVREREKARRVATQPTRDPRTGRLITSAGDRPRAAA